MAYLCGADDLSASAFAFRGAFNDTRQIKDLDFCSTIFENSRDSRQGCEGVCGNFRLCLSDLRQKGRLSDRGKADESDSSIS